MEKDYNKYNSKVGSSAKDQYFLINREYVHKAIDHFTLVFKFYVVEMLKRAYGDQYLLAIANGPENDTTMSSSEGNTANINLAKITKLFTTGTYRNFSKFYRYFNQS